METNEELVHHVGAQSVSVSDRGHIESLRLKEWIS